jgi:hypothetical protein
MSKHFAIKKGIAEVTFGILRDYICFDTFAHFSQQWHGTRRDFDI